MTFLLATYTLFQREVVRFLRQKHRIIGALGTPIVFWILIGSGLGKSFSGSLSYLQYFFPGTVLLILLFTAIFSTISIIEDRREGFLQAVLVAPVPRAALAAGKLLGGATLAFGQGVLFLVFTPLLGISMGITDILFLLFILFTVSIALTGLGFVIAWRLDSTQGFHAVMNLFLMPLWFLSGALFPAQGAPVWLQWVMKLNPLSYSLAALHRGLYHGTFSPAVNYPSALTCALVTVGFAVLMSGLSVSIASGRESVKGKTT